ncbi:hypothetical protein H8356DRAFT_1620559 [Neocallimastix lanati (nom. inval.)]|uniref:Uncharacterized protein n=1 Tax=Neocallimastix californiae TaxID=1754190 RepID=A0A1Y1YNM4_9FUNG|nr:hypothetical protein H8356DRAFT_1620559 [Neocallimastix sp. JGI-2020a]ORX99602.1 hypothetical protein LY90DRAFT_678758 [Neocallimastix californiae]|eukprot:ORX99602.1 hypothetical protein LY90DRAFT_678758 [Neocallimastix californiae]
MQFFILILTMVVTKGEIEIPSIINIEEEGGFALMATKPDYIYNNEGKIIGMVNGDRPLKNCKYNIKENKIICDYEDDEKYIITFNVKINDGCNIDESTIFKSVNLYGINFEKKYSKTNFIIYYEKDNNKKITHFEVTAKYFEFLTKDGCKINALITNSTMNKIEQDKQ